jgi:para-nitrobenzyl esterase
VSASFAAACSDDKSEPNDARDSAVAAAPNESDAGADGSAPAAPPSCRDADADLNQCRACVHQGLLAGKGSDGMCAYLGVPYAKPPVGELRFAAPEPADNWSDTRDAMQFGPACVQAQGAVSLTGGADTNEDCLYLNVWTPSGTPSAALPVMVFIHGGGYTTGASNTFLGNDLVKKGPVILVTINYRLGALGFFAQPELDKQRKSKPAGSDAIRDQQLALQWVHDNIASFHGDPANVTLFGESAGSSAVGVHLVSPGSRGLVTRYLMESGVTTRGVSSGIEPATRDARYQRSQQLADGLCPDAADKIACLRGLPADTIIAWTPPVDPNVKSVGPVLGWVPEIEGEGGVLPDEPDALMQAGKFNPGEILVGTNKNEFGFFQLIGSGARVMSASDMRSEVMKQFGAKTDEIMAIYLPGGSGDASAAYLTLMTDIMFRCGTRHFARLAFEQKRTVYLYSFEQATAFHSEELIYVFGPGNFTIPLNSSPAAGLTAIIQSYWLNYARGGDPNGKDLLSWPVYETSSDKNIVLVDPTPSVASAFRKDGCDYWDAYLANK